MRLGKGVEATGMSVSGEIDKWRENLGGWESWSDERVS